MIPAILTCVFVVYLYRKLNSDSDPINPNSSLPNKLTALADRLPALESRLRQLADNNSKQEA